jgi:prepilin-type N-terminal cleavage/methylation domain-containing protein
MPISPPQTDSAAHGFTLVEVLVALVVLALLSAVSARVLQGSLQARQIQRNEHAALSQRADYFSRQLSGEREEPVVTLERLEDEEN